MAAELLDDRGEVAVVVGVVVVEPAAAEEPEPDATDEVPVVDWPDVPVGAAVELELGVGTDDEWAWVPEATITPRPAAAAEAATPMAMVVRRTRVVARSRACAAGWGAGMRSRGGGVMAVLSGGVRWTGATDGRIFLGPSDRSGSRVTSSPPVRSL